MVNSIRLYLDAALGVAIMAALGVIAGFVAAGVTGDRTLALTVAGIVFILTGAVLIVRLWRITHQSPVPLDPGI
jgi:hypothetical protein